MRRRAGSDDHIRVGRGISRGSRSLRNSGGSGERSGHVYWCAHPASLRQGPFSRRRHHLHGPGNVVLWQAYQQLQTMVRYRQALLRGPPQATSARSLAVPHPANPPRPNRPESLSLGRCVPTHAGNGRPMATVPARDARQACAGSKSHLTPSEVRLDCRRNPIACPQTVNCPSRHRPRHPIIRAGRGRPRNFSLNSVQSLELGLPSGIGCYERVWARSGNGNVAGRL